MKKKTFQNALSLENRSFRMKVERFRDINKFAKANKDEALSGSAEEQSSSLYANNVKEKEDRIKALKRKLLFNRSASKKLSLNSKPETTEDLIEKVLRNQSEILEKLDNLEKYVKENVAQNCNLMANSLTTKECKVLIQKVHRSLIRITGEDDKALQIEIEATLPMTSIEEVEDVEQKIQQNPEYIKALKLYMLQIKGRTGTVDGVFRQLMADELIYLFNFDGRMEKRALMQLTLINELLSGMVFARQICRISKERF